MTDHLRSGKTSEITFELLATEGQAGKVRDGLLKLVRQCQSASVAGEEAVEGGTGPKRVPAGKDEPARSTGVDQIARPLD